MTRHLFGWSYPPGAANDPNAPWNQDDGPCAVCHKPVDDCVCPECPVCHSNGDPACYEFKPDPISFDRVQHLRLTREQRLAIAEHHVVEAEERLADATYALEIARVDKLIDETTEED